MKAFVVDRYGQSGVRLADVATPTVGMDDVLVDIRAASINPLDTMVRNGEFKQLLKYKLPFILGHDVAGVITEVGSRVRDFSVGDKIFARPRDLRIGTFAESIAIDQRDIARMPTALTFTEAAAVPLVALTSWQALHELADVKPGHRVLIHAGAGGLGSTAIQIAKHLGGHVTTTARTENFNKVGDLGADEVIDYTKQDFAELLTEYDVVLDSLGGANLEKSLTVLRRGGLAISVVGPPDPAFAAQLDRPLLSPVMRMLSYKTRRRAKKLGVRYTFLFMKANGTQLKELAELYDSGALRPVLDRTFEFDETIDAIAYVAQGKANGKIVVIQ